MNNLVQFNNHNLEIINKNGQKYFSAPQVGAALGYARSDKITQIYNRHADEFAPDMSDTLKLRLSGNLETEVRVFSLRGCHLLAMFSKTPVAKEFRRWVLDLIEQQNQSVTNCHQLDAKAIGGIVKKCVNKALNDFLSNDLPAPIDENDVLRQKYYNITDQNMVEMFQRWYWSRNYDVRQALDQSAQRIEELETKLRMVQKALA